MILFTFSSLRILGCFANLPPLSRIPEQQGESDVFTRTRIVIVTALVSVAIAASVIAVDDIRVPDPSIYVLLAAGVLALIMLRRRTS